MTQGCPNCAVLQDELNAARSLLGEDTKTLEYLEFTTRVEFARIWSDHNGDRLYVHCEQAWGESEAEFNDRYKRIRDVLGRKYRQQQKTAPPPGVDPVIAAPRDNELFTGRL